MAEGEAVVEVESGCGCAVVVRVREWRSAREDRRFIATFPCILFFFSEREERLRKFESGL